MVVIVVSAAAAAACSCIRGGGFNTGGGFTVYPPELAEIRKASFAWVICATLDKIETIQPLVLLQPKCQAMSNLQRVG